MDHWALSLVPAKLPLGLGAGVGGSSQSLDPLECEYGEEREILVSAARDKVGSDYTNEAGEGGGPNGDTRVRVCMSGFRDTAH